MSYESHFFPQMVWNCTGCIRTSICGNRGKFPGIVGPGSVGRFVGNVCVGKVGKVGKVGFVGKGPKVNAEKIINLHYLCKFMVIYILGATVVVGGKVAPGGKVI